MMAERRSRQGEMSEPAPRQEAWQRTVRRGDGRDALCAALVRVFAKKGLDGVTFRSVAAEAGVTPGLASYHFPTREAMINEALSWATARAVDGLETAAQTPDGSRFAYLPRVVSNSEAEAAFQFALALESLRRPDLRRDVQAAYEGYIEATAVYLERFGLAHDADVARLVFAAKDGLVLQQLIFGDSGRVDRALALLDEMLRAAADRPTPKRSGRDRASGRKRKGRQPDGPARST